MCGRYTRTAALKLIRQYFGIAVPESDEAEELTPSWNVAPKTFQPVIRINPSTGAKEVAHMRWGLVPYFAKSSDFNFSTVNAKAETLLDKRSFREPFRRRRCLVPVDGYYEWQTFDAKKKKKQTWAIGMKSGKTFALGGIWDYWISPDKQSWLEGYSIVTTEPNELLRALHDRMPLIIGEEDYDRWLGPGDPSNPPVDLLRPFPSEKRKIWRIKPDVGNVKNDRPDLIEPYDPPADPDEPPMLF